MSLDFGGIYEVTQMVTYTKEGDFSVRVKDATAKDIVAADKDDERRTNNANTQLNAQRATPKAERMNQLAGGNIEMVLVVRQMEIIKQA